MINIIYEVQEFVLETRWVPTGYSHRDLKTCIAYLNKLKSRSNPEYFRLVKVTKEVIK